MRWGWMVMSLSQFAQSIWWSVSVSRYLIMYLTISDKVHPIPIFLTLSSCSSGTTWLQFFIFCLGMQLPLHRDSRWVEARRENREVQVVQGNKKNNRKLTLKMQYTAANCYDVVICFAHLSVSYFEILWSVYMPTHIHCRSHDNTCVLYLRTLYTVRLSPPPLFLPSLYHLIRSPLTRPPNSIPFHSIPLYCSGVQQAHFSEHWSVRQRHRHRESEHRHQLRLPRPGRSVKRELELDAS